MVAAYQGRTRNVQYQLHLINTRNGTIKDLRHNNMFICQGKEFYQYYVYFVLASGMDLGL